jgi:D-arabinose 1-dehydrogenase-like Zn-dependent alcohol dehydrogenase
LLGAWGGGGGGGFSALLLARLLGARAIAVDRIAGKRALAERLGAQAVDDVRAIRDADVVLDLVGEPSLRTQSLRALARGGRLVLVALDNRPFEFDPYRDVLAREARIIGSSDHTLEELRELMSFAAEGSLDVSPVITRRVPLEAEAVNRVLDDLERGTSELRSAIVL